MSWVVVVGVSGSGSGFEVGSPEFKRVQKGYFLYLKTFEAFEFDAPFWTENDLDTFCKSSVVLVDGKVKNLIAIKKRIYIFITFEKNGCQNFIFLKQWCIRSRADDRIIHGSCLDNNKILAYANR
jgi:hypothetical protein